MVTRHIPNPNAVEYATLLDKFAMFTGDAMLRVPSRYYRQHYTYLEVEMKCHCRRQFL